MSRGEEKIKNVFSASFSRVITAERCLLRLLAMSAALCDDREYRGARGGTKEPTEEETKKTTTHL